MIFFRAAYRQRNTDDAVLSETDSNGQAPNALRASRTNKFRPRLSLRRSTMPGFDLAATKQISA
jgi:hypothetical protein